MYLIKNNKLGILSNKLIILNSKLSILSNKLISSSNKLSILVHTILVQAILVQAIISNKLSIINNKLSILSNKLIISSNKISILVQAILVRAILVPRYSCAHDILYYIKYSRGNQKAREPREDPVQCQHTADDLWRGTAMAWSLSGIPRDLAGIP